MEGLIGKGLCISRLFILKSNGSKDLYLLWIIRQWKESIVLFLRFYLSPIRKHSLHVQVYLQRRNRQRLLMCGGISR